MNKLLIISVVLAMLTGCKSTKSETSVAKSVLLPANVVGMQTARSIAVVSVKQHNRYWEKENITNQFEAFLTNITVNGQPYYNVVDRQTMDKVMKEQRLSSRHTFDQQTSAKLGRLVGADILLTAAYKLNKDTNSYRKKSSKCSKKRESNGKLGKLLGATTCEEYYDTTISCSKRTVNVQFTPKATAVGTGHVVYAKSYTGEATSDRCNNGYDDPLEGYETMQQKALQHVFSQMRRDVAPYVVTLNMDMMKKDESQMPAGVKAEFDEGLFFVKESLLNRACAKFTASAKSYQSPAILYNLGVCHELKGQNDSALAYYNKALDMSAMLDKKGKKLVISAIKRHQSGKIAEQEGKEGGLLELAEGIGSALFN